ncbi:MAG: CRISPR-associated endonuclease Cas1, partial [Cyanobium sp.]
PPLTPFDALCGFGYGVLWNALLLRAELRGLDPYNGVLHVGSPRHAALVSDLIEPLRTFLVDPFHGQLIRAGQLSAAEHFQPHGGGVYLNDAGRRFGCGPGRPSWPSRSSWERPDPAHVGKCSISW